MGKLLKNSRGEYNYHFNWMDENGHTCGFNNVWATNKREAVKLAKAMETKAHWSLYEGGEYITVKKEVLGKGHCFRMKGMYVSAESMRKANAELRSAMDRLGHMMSC